MKPTSFIYLALAVVLIIGGIFSCKYAESRAEKQGVKIFEQQKDEEGNLVLDYRINDINISSLSLVFSDVDVVINSTDENSKALLSNFEVNDYAITLSGSSLKIDGTVSFLESLLDRSKGGFSFRGMRYFFSEKPEEGKKGTVTVNISSLSKLNSLSVNVKNGKLTINGLKNPIDYNIDVKNGDVELKDVSTVSLADITVSEGEAVINSSLINTISAEVTRGNIRINADGLYDSTMASYNVISSSGSIIYNGAAIEDDIYKNTAANQKTNIKINITDGNAYIKDAE
ncbi:MAG: DUF4097 family beta strand repeat protein [Firmicutes bacterium]|nr:DUF4097 family beta strand repeat protein [Candidatus Colimorpha enterica]